MKHYKLFDRKAEQYARENAEIIYMKSTWKNGHVTITCEKPQVEKKPTWGATKVKAQAYTLCSRPVFYKNGQVISRPKNHKNN